MNNNNSTPRFPGQQTPLGKQPGRRGQGGQPPQMPPGFPPGGPGPGGQPPPTAPPNFSPELPRMGGQPLTGRPEFPGQFEGAGALFRRRPRDFRGCLNKFTYIWLLNGNNFWFYPISSDRQFVEGFRWRRRGWVFDRINLNRILFFRCF